MEKQVTVGKFMEIYETRNYGIFKRLKGNRDITNKRIAIIKASIESVGYISNPIICNEKFEIIDGQGRYEALKQLDLPIEYRTISGIGIEECRAMNLKPTSWSIEDFVKSYAEYGNDNYIRLLNIYEKHSIPLTTIYALCVNTNNSGRKSQEVLRKGIFELSEKRAEEVNTICEYLKEFKDIQKKIGGRSDLFYGCIGWIALQPNVDKARLKVSMHQQYKTVTPFARTEDSLKEISDVYNKGYAKNNRRYFDYEWKCKDVKDNNS